MKAGKHVYCEKPLTHNVWEARAVARVAAETGVATQMGNQGRSGEGHRQTVEWIADGAIGAVREVHAWSGAAGRPRTHAARGTPPVPRGLDWDLWLGPREPRAVPPGVRPVHLAQLLGLRRRRAAGHGGPQRRSRLQRARPRRAGDRRGLRARGRRRLCSRGLLVTWRFAARGPAGRCRCTGTTAGCAPRLPRRIDPDDPKQRLGEGENGILFVGERGCITCAGWSGMPRLLPLERHRDYVRPARTLARVEGHHADWLQACKGGRPACSHFGYGARLTELLLLGNVALRTGRP